MGILSILKGSKNEFYLENVRDKNLKFPRTFIVAKKKDVDSLTTGALVKLIFVLNKPTEEGCRAEKMWVRIVEHQNGLFKGILDNDPVFIKTIKCGETISFKAENIASIYGAQSPFNEKLFAIVTKKALEKRQINWIVRSSDPNHEEDSGWQFFYGDESTEYLDKSDNASIILLEEALSFEPLLEEVLGGDGDAYEYSEKLNRFVEFNESVH